MQAQCTILDQILTNLLTFQGSKYTLRGLVDRMLFWLFSGKDTDLYALIEKLECAHTLIETG
jgi:hypothetical protein